jgi:hypothetical protein
MSTAIPDLWPDDFGKSTETPPVLILREQAELLGRKTRGAVQGLVQTTRDGDGFLHIFYLMAPSLDQYTYTLFNIRHGVSFYPLDLADHAGRVSKIMTQDHLTEALRTIFSSENTKRVVRAILAQVEEPVPGGSVAGG